MKLPSGECHKLHSNHCWKYSCIYAKIDDHVYDIWCNLAKIQIKNQSGIKPKCTMRFTDGIYGNIMQYIFMAKIFTTSCWICVEFVHIQPSKWLVPVHAYTKPSAWIILCMRPANERRRYNVTSSPFGWVHTQNDPCFSAGDGSVHYSGRVLKIEAQRKPCSKYKGIIFEHHCSCRCLGS